MGLCTSVGNIRKKQAKYAETACSGLIHVEEVTQPQDIVHQAHMNVINQKNVYNGKLILRNKKNAVSGYYNNKLSTEK